MQTIVGVLRGGPSAEHEMSLRNGAAMLANLPEARFLVRDIYIDREGAWHERGRPTTPDRVLRQMDVALIALLGPQGEDGHVQKLLLQFGVPYAGSDALASHFAQHKVLAKMRAKEEGLLVPDFKYIERVEDAEDAAREIIRTFHQPVIVKPVGWGSSVGVSVVGGYAPLLSTIKGVFAAGAPSVLVEEYVRGREASVGVVEGLRGEPYYALPTVEVTPEGEHHSYEEKSSGSARHACPGRFNRQTNEELQRLARVMHRALGARHYSRSDFIVAPKGIYYLETNALPALSSESLFAKSLAAVGIPFPDFLAHLVHLARA